MTVKELSCFEIKNIIQNAIKHWLKPTDCGVVALHFEGKRMNI